MPQVALISACLAGFIAGFTAIPNLFAKNPPSSFFLVIFRLKSLNMLVRNIPGTLCYLSSVHVLDLALNNLSGPIPKCLRNLTALKLPGLLFKFLLSTLHVPYSSHAELNAEGRLVEYTSIISLVNIIDLSCNNLSGVMPEEIKNLSTLVTLNFSWNQLTSMIPENIGSLKQLEDPDLSSNHHSGLFLRA
jgi:Leucine-rich repeat (LRR) protein